MPPLVSPSYLPHSPSRPARRSDAAWSAYRDRELIARGGMADIYRAVDESGQLVALKRLRATGAMPLVRALFAAEASLLASMDHPNVVRAVDISAARGGDFFAMEYVDGVDLERLMVAMRRRGTALPVNVCVAIVAEIAAGLDHAHELEVAPGVHAGIVHRDLTPKNVLVGFDGAVKLADFGVACVDRHTRADRRMISGRPGYMSPEQLVGTHVDRRSDVFSLGVVLWELVTGRSLFAGSNAAERAHSTLIGDVPSPSALLPGFPAAVDRVLDIALARDPLRRYPTARAMLSALLEFQRVTPGQAHGLISAAAGELVGRAN